MSPGDVDIARVGTDLWVLRDAMLGRTLAVNAYIGRAPDGVLRVVDAGLAIGSEERWIRALALIGHVPADIADIVITHHHPDHLGGAASLHALSGARIRASRSTIDQAPDVWGDSMMDRYLDRIDRQLVNHGAPTSLPGRLLQERAYIRQAIRLPPADSWVEIRAGDRTFIGDREWTVHDAPGHADGHIVLLAGDGTLLAGDHLLETISPAVGRFPGHAPDPLGLYLESLDRVRALRPTTVLPGHGAAFGNVDGRIDELVRHHAERIGLCVAAVYAQSGGSGGRGASAWHIAHSVFPRVFTSSSDQSSPADARFATTETIAHLERAVREGSVAREVEAGGAIRYVPVS